MFLLAFLLTPLTIFLHELGHFLLALQSSRPAQLHLTSVSGGATTADAMWLQAAQQAGGPLITLLLTVAGLIVFKRGGRPWAFALVVAASSRFATHLGYLGVRALLLAMQKPFGSKPNVDELVFARILGLSEPLISASVVMVFLARERTSAIRESSPKSSHSAFHQ